MSLNVSLIHMGHPVITTVLFFVILIPLSFLSAYVYDVLFPLPPDEDKKEPFDSPEDREALEALYVDANEK